MQTSVVTRVIYVGQSQSPERPIKFLGADLAWECRVRMLSALGRGVEPYLCVFKCFFSIGTLFSLQINN